MNAEEELTAAVKQAGGSPRLILLNGPHGTRKTSIFRSVARQFNRPVINLGIEIAEQLLPFSERTRRLELRRVLQAIAGSDAILFLDNLEVLFEPTLKADSFGCLDELARDRTVAAVWPATAAPIAPMTILIHTEERS